MTTTHAPRFAYPFAVAAGLFGLVFYGLLSMIEGAPGGGHYAVPLAILLAGFAVGHFVLGGAFGILWPWVAWRWGVWLCAAPACLISFCGRGVWFFLGWLALTMLPACAGAYTAAALRPGLVASAGR